MNTDAKVFPSLMKRTVAQLTIAISGVFLAVFGLSMFNQYILMSFSLPLRMIFMIITQWLLFLVPGFLMLVNNERFKDLGFTKKNMSLQIGIGLLLALSMSLVLTVLPIMLGFQDMVGSTAHTKLWKFVFQFVYAIFGVALAEELIFRGFLYHKLLAMGQNKWFAIIFSSILFGLFHIFNGSIIQVVITACYGLMFCLFREKIKGCTLVSLIVAHGVYDALIVLWVSIG